VGVTLAGRFTIEAEAGAGGMGRVYRALDRVGGEVVALKVPSTEDGENVERFSREAQVLAKLSHPAVVRYVDHAFWAGRRRARGGKASWRCSKPPSTRVSRSRSHGRWW
jgi:serine/threonine protein kinase